MFSFSNVVGHLEAGVGVGFASQIQAPGNPSTLNCTWKYITQPLDHFGATSHTYQERYCIYDKFWSKAKQAGFASGQNEMAPIFFTLGMSLP
jgi:hypothetical protein